MKKSKKTKKLEVIRVTLACKRNDLSYEYYVEVCESRGLKPLSKNTYDNY